jgi:hypothetical protein
LRIRCLSVDLLRFMNEFIGRIQWPIWNVHKWIGWQSLGTKWISMTTPKYGTSNIWSECQSKQNEKLSLQAAWAK